MLLTYLALIHYQSYEKHQKSMKLSFFCYCELVARTLSISTKDAVMLYFAESLVRLTPLLLLIKIFITKRKII